MKTIEEIIKEFEEKSYPYIHSEIVDDEKIMGRLKSFLRQAIKEALMSVVPEERVEYYPQAHSITDYELQEQQRAMGWNSARQEMPNKMNKFLEE